MLRRGLVIAAAMLVLDQLTKWWIVSVFALPARGMVEVLPFFNLTMVWNRGISFGLLPAGSDLGRWLLVAVTAGIAVAVVIWLRRAQDWPTGVGLGLILGGAVGNIIDRVVQGAVVDFIELHAFGYSFFVFNVADAAITIGVALLLWDAILSGKNGDAAREGEQDRQNGSIR